jgi:eukaryotic-like serine/threonine-protein kinase
MFSPTPASDANLLVGLLALQGQLISRPELVAAVRQWVQGRSNTLGKVLVERGALMPDELAALDTLVGRLLDRHDGSVETTLAANTCLRSVRAALGAVGDADLQGCLERVGGPNVVETAALPASRPGASAPGFAGSRFRIERLLEKGNLGSLFLARDEELARDVVIKQIHAEYANDADAQARFTREVKYAAELEHTGIVPIYGAGHHEDGRRYYAMRYIKGENLRAAIERCHQIERASRRWEQLRPLVPRFAAVCRAIAYAHERGVLHRDIKPENIMLSADGETIVVDWGLAKSVDNSGTTGAAAEATLMNRGKQDVNPTQQFQAVGTAAYMSPETACGELDRVGPRSDVYSLGATLYHLLTGQPPFVKAPSSSEPILTKVQKGAFLRPRKIFSEVPASLEAVCLKAMALLPDARYRTARALAEDLERWVAGNPVKAEPESWTTRTARRVGRRPLLTTSVAAVALAVVGTLALITMPHRDRDPELQALQAKLDDVSQQLTEKNGALSQAAGELKAKQGELAAEQRDHGVLKKQFTDANREVKQLQGDLQSAGARADEAVKKAAAADLALADARKRRDDDAKLLKDLSGKMKDLAAVNRDAERRLQAMERFRSEAKDWFNDSVTATKRAYEAAKEQIKDPKSEEADTKRRLEFAKLQRNFGDLLMVVENHDAAEKEYRYAKEAFEDLEKDTPIAREGLALTRNNLALLLATHIDASKRKPQEAVQLARQALAALLEKKGTPVQGSLSAPDLAALAIDKLPKRADFVLTYGIALYRGGKWEEAKQVLKQANAVLKTGDPYDYDTSLYFLAMVECRLKNAPNADRWLEEARKSTDKRPPSLDVERFRAEAERLRAELKKAP